MEQAQSSAMIKPTTNEAIPILTQKLSQSNFACMVRDGLED